MNIKLFMAIPLGAILFLHSWGRSAPNPPELCPESHLLKQLDSFYQPVEANKKTIELRVWTGINSVEHELFGYYFIKSQGEWRGKMIREGYPQPVQQNIKPSDCNWELWFQSMKDIGIFNMEGDEKLDPDLCDVWLLDSSNYTIFVEYNYYGQIHSYSYQSSNCELAKYCPEFNYACEIFRPLYELRSMKIFKGTPSW